MCGAHTDTEEGAHTDTEEGPGRLKCLEGNMCSCLTYIVTINPPKDTEKYFANDEAVRSNINLLTNRTNDGDC